MTRFNTTKVGTKTTNYEGGAAFKESDALGLISLLVTSMLTDKFYEGSEKTLERLEAYWNNLKTTKDGREYFMKSACYARDYFNLRSITHVCASLVGEGVVNNSFSLEEKPLLKRFFSKIIKRPGDITEIIACYKDRDKAYKSKKGTVQLPSVMKKGFSNAMKNYDEYLLAKYKQSKKDVSMVDAIRMCHTKHTDKNNDAITKLLYGELKNTTTWQAVSSEAGKSDKTKKEVWSEFLNKENVEYFSLLRNLRNILEESDSAMRKKASELLTDREHIKKSKVLPFRFLQAYSAIDNESDKEGKRTILSAISKAVDLAVDNVPVYDGKTLIIVDISGSMFGNSYHYGFDNNPITVASLFATALYRKNPESDIILFNGEPTWFTPNPEDSIVTNSQKIIGKAGGGTYMGKAFQLFSEKDYDRVILLSDEQTFETAEDDDDYYYGERANQYWEKYTKTHKNAKLFSIDLAGYGTLQFPENNVFCLAGYSDHIFDIIGKLDEDKHYFVNEVRKYEI